MGTQDRNRQSAAGAAVMLGLAAVAVAFSTELTALIAIALWLAALAWIAVAASPPSATGRAGMMQYAAIVSIAAGAVALVLAVL